MFPLPLQATTRPCTPARTTAPTTNPPPPPPPLHTSLPPRAHQRVPHHPAGSGMAGEHLDLRPIFRIRYLFKSVRWFFFKRQRPTLCQAHPPLLDPAQGACIARTEGIDPVRVHFLHPLRAMHPARSHCQHPRRAGGLHHGNGVEQVLRSI